MSLFFTSDTHFFHANIIKYAERPFKDEYEMNEALIKNWNSVVDDNDDVYHMGDFAVGLAGRSKELSELAQRVKGRIYLIRGNHERAAENFIPKRFEWIKDYFELKISRSISAVLFHYACRVWNASHHGVFQLYGHSHADLPDRPYDLQMDVGVDTEYANYTPLGLDQVVAFMAAKQKAWEALGPEGQAKYHRESGHHGRTDDVPSVGRK